MSFPQQNSLVWQPIPGGDGSSKNFLANLQLGYYLPHPRDSELPVKSEESAITTVASKNDGFLTKEEENGPRNLDSFLQGQMADYYNQKLETSRKTEFTEETLAEQIEEFNRVLRQVFDSYTPVPQQHLKDGGGMIAANETIEAPDLKGHKSFPEIQLSLANANAGGTKRQPSTDVTPTKNALPLSQTALPDPATGAGASTPLDSDSDNDVIYIGEVSKEIVRHERKRKLDLLQKYLQTLQRVASVELVPKSASNVRSFDMPYNPFGKISAKRMGGQLIEKKKEN